MGNQLIMSDASTGIYMPQWGKIVSKRYLVQMIYICYHTGAEKDDHKDTS